MGVSRNGNGKTPAEVAIAKAGTGRPRALAREAAGPIDTRGNEACLQGVGRKRQVCVWGKKEARPLASLTPVDRTSEVKPGNEATGPLDLVKGMCDADAVLFRGKSGPRGLVASKWRTGCAAERARGVTGQPAPQGTPEGAPAGSHSGSSAHFGGTGSGASTAGGHAYFAP